MISITKKSFGFMPDGREVFSYLLDNGKNVKAEIKLMMKENARAESVIRNTEEFALKHKTFPMP